MGDEKKDEKDRWAVRAWLRTYPPMPGFPSIVMGIEEASDLQRVLNELTKEGFGIEHIDYARNFVVGKRSQNNLGQLLIERLVAQSPPPSAGRPAEPSEEDHDPLEENNGVVMPFMGERTSAVVSAISECAAALETTMPVSLVERGAYSAVEAIFKDAGPIQAEKTLSDLPSVLSGHQRMYHDGRAVTECPSEKAVVIFEQQIKRYLRTNLQS